MRKKQNFMIALLGATMLLFASCNKNQKAVKKLDGSWNATNYFIDDLSEEGVTVDVLTMDDYKLEIEFNSCKLKDNESCPSVWTYTDEEGVEKESNTFTVSNDGETLVVTEKGTAIYNYQYRIEELTKSELTLVGFGEEEGQKIILEKK